MNRVELANHIFEALKAKKEDLTCMYKDSQSEIGYFYIDDLLPLETAKSIYLQFPDRSSMKLKKSFREYKYVAAQMSNYNPILEEAVYAFQDLKVVSLIKDICGISSLYPDENLYAGGISLMGNKQYLNPHLDNSHDKDRKMWRVLNLLYYVSPDWKDNYGGNLELWPNGLDEKQLTIHSKFNRLVVMATHDNSWHSVSPLTVDEKLTRCCVSNYYFSDLPLKKDDQFHVTSFRGRPEQRLVDFILKVDAKFRMKIRHLFKNGVLDTKHRYLK